MPTGTVDSDYRRVIKFPGVRLTLVSLCQSYMIYIYLYSYVLLLPVITIYFVITDKLLAEVFSNSRIISSFFATYLSGTIVSKALISLSRTVPAAHALATFDTRMEGVQVTCQSQSNKHV